MALEQIRVIENNYKNSNIDPNNNEDDAFIIECDCCDSKLEITKALTHIGALGQRYITCPCCGNETGVDALDGIELSIDNIEFPVHFLRINADRKVVKEIGADEIIRTIKTGICYLEEHNDEDYWYEAYGDMFLIIFNYDEDNEYYIVVAKDFYETYLPFED
jgi:hypothetical protein